ncbi:MAG: hypothetical protein IAF02_12900 [Anaerolineae bacterium]|nr:hypothetical protein [Anaerolineae bacterium]
MYTYVKPFVKVPLTLNFQDVVFLANVESEEVQASLKVLIVLSEYENRITELVFKLKRLRELPMCGGQLEYRASGALAVHSTSCDCPFPGHQGTVKGGRGVRRYVRKGDLKEVIEAQERFVLWQQVDAELGALKQERDCLLAQLRKAGRIAETAVLKN